VIYIPFNQIRCSHKLKNIQNYAEVAERLKLFLGKFQYLKKEFRSNAPAWKAGSRKGAQVQILSSAYNLLILLIIMAKLRPARCTREKKRPWTRQSRKKPRIGYVKGVPQTKIRRYVTGTRADYETSFYLTCTSKLQIRDNSIEAARIAISNYLQKNIKLNFYLSLRKYPFQIIREHKQAAVAGADRFFAGMRHSFGKPAGMAVIMNKNGILFELKIDKKYEHLAKNAFKRASQKLSGNYKIIEQESVKPKEITKIN